MRAVLRKALGQALKWGLVARNVATLVNPPKGRRPEFRALTSEQAQAFLRAADDDQLGALYTVAMALGLRQGEEALGLRWEDVDMEARTLRVRAALQRVEGKLRFVEPKSASSRRTLPIPDALAEVLPVHFARHIKDRQLAGDRWQEHDLVFSSTIGTALDGKNVTRRFKVFLERVGLPQLRFHDLRHTCASLLLAQQVHPRVVMETLGHSQISLIMNTYSHVIPVLQREAADLMDILLKQSASTKK